jgi:hypothetical protein
MEGRKHAFTSIMCDLQALKAYELVALADAQAISVLWATQKGTVSCDDHPSQSTKLNHTPVSNPQVLKAYELVALADAQAISVLRAIQKGNTASLVSAIAADTAEMYRQSAAAIARAPLTPAGRPGAPVAAYTSWKALALDAYALTYAGIRLLLFTDSWNSSFQITFSYVVWGFVGD